ncbi:recombinase family protein [Fundicoccus sp. Sow4_H7]|uniref:recombinase family protein n=1 Tax=Fundicoccus sp. Sow4_H7 TaxID=3438784 RepID=UPI003F93319A
MSQPFPEIPFQQGKIQVNHNRFFGYTKDEEGNLVINSEQAIIVKKIFREYLEGPTLKVISDGLIKDGILTAAGKKTLAWGKL